jgi:hypothetical protein
MVKTGFSDAKYIHYYIHGEKSGQTNRDVVDGKAFEKTN